MPTVHNNSATGYQWCVVLPDKTKSKGYLVAHQNITIPGKFTVAGSDHVRIGQGKAFIEKGGAKQASSTMPTTLAGLMQRQPPAAASPKK